MKKFLTELSLTFIIKEDLKKGYIRTIRELLGHKNVETTMIYTHVINRGGKGVRSPVDFWIRLCCLEQHIQNLHKGVNMYIVFNNKQLIKNSNINLGCLEKQHLLFSLVHLFSC